MDLNPNKTLVKKNLCNVIYYESIIYDKFVF